MDIKRLTARCASCRKLLGDATDEGWMWCGPPARLVNRRRLITELDEGVEPPSSSFDDFRMRTVEVVRETLEREPGSPDGTVRGRLLMTRRFKVWEYPYVCNTDACMNALGEEWGAVRSDGPAFSVMPDGRVLS